MIDRLIALDASTGARLYTFFMYLSTPEGGGTRFHDLGLTVPARKGSAVLWPSVSDADPAADEPYTNHEALPVEVGRKYASNVCVRRHGRPLRAGAAPHASHSACTPTRT